MFDDDGCIYVQLSKSEHALVNSKDVEETVQLAADYQGTLIRYGNLKAGLKFYPTVAMLLAAGF